MKKTLAFALALGGVAALSGCGGSTPTPAPAPEAKPAAPAASAVPAPPAAPAAMPAAEAAAAPAAEAPKQPDTAVAPEPAAGDAAAKLLGTTWTMPDGTELNFKDATNVHVKGGQAAVLGAGGVGGSYTFTNGTLEIKVLGRPFSGTWDGEKLTISGADGVKKAQ